MPDDGFLDFGLPLDRGALIIDGVPVDVNITSAISAASVERTIEGPSVLELDLIDETHALSDTKLFAKQPWKATLKVSGLTWRLSEISKTVDGWHVVFYDAAAAAMKDKHGAFKAARDQSTRAQFMQQLATRAGVAFSSPDKDVKQPIQPFSTTEQADRRHARESATSQSGSRTNLATGSKWWKGANITIKGAKATAQQLRNLTTAMATAEQVGAFPDLPIAVKAMLVAGIHESRFLENVSDYRYHTHTGVWQSDQIPGDQVATQAEYFLKGGRSFGAGGAIHLAKTTNLTAGGIADKVEVGGIGAAPYDKYGAEADKIMAAYSPGDGEQSLADLQSLTGNPDVARVRKYEFKVGAEESYWAAGVRLASEVRWRFFALNGVIWFVSDTTLANPKTVRPSMRIQEGVNGVDSVLWQYDRTGKLTEATVECHLTKWAALPGQVVVLEGEAPVANGRWLVRSISRPDLLGDDGAATVTLGRPEPPKQEPKSSLIVQAGTSADSSFSKTFTGRLGSGKGTVVVAPGANRAGVPLQQPIRTFLQFVAGVLGDTITVTTGSNHSQYTTSGNVSDHWAGNAADIGVNGDAHVDKAAGAMGDRIAAAALVVLGVDGDAALQMAKSGQLDFSQSWQWQGHRVQVGWRTLVGGNHYNHVHIGVSGPSTPVRSPAGGTSSNLVVVPDCAGLSYDSQEGPRRLRAAGLASGISGRSSGPPWDGLHVVGSSPPAGSKVPPHTLVGLIYK